MQDTLTALKSLITEQFGVETKDLAPGTSILESGLDSLGFAELMFVIEDKFGIQFPELKTDVHTLGELASLIDSLKQPVLAA